MTFFKSNPLGGQSAAGKDTQTHNHDDPLTALAPSLSRPTAAHDTSASRTPLYRPRRPPLSLPVLAKDTHVAVLAMDRIETPIQRPVRPVVRVCLVTRERRADG